MKKYWVMKTFQEWWANFQSDGLIGIDESGVDGGYLELSNDEIRRLLEDQNNNFNDYQNRVFQQFCQWMQVDDFVLIGTGQTTTFNLSGIARVSGQYEFRNNPEPRHYRPVEILKVFESPRSMQRFIRTPRLERIDEADFHESIISLI
ncbi:hypothetical protein H0Z60_18860 [Ectothiorhodospiraceae bacterium WFHF3C12]|nr:hypothetical protein [Ectothiorhodospiraceae bacterium WFHF3C12]